MIKTVIEYNFYMLVYIQYVQLSCQFFSSMHDKSILLLVLIHTEVHFFVHSLHKVP